MGIKVLECARVQLGLYPADCAMQEHGYTVEQSEECLFMLLSKDTDVCSGVMKFVQEKSQSSEN